MLHKLAQTIDTNFVRFEEGGEANFTQVLVSPISSKLVDPLREGAAYKTELVAAHHTEEVVWEKTTTFEQRRTCPKEPDSTLLDSLYIHFMKKYFCS